MPLYQAQKNLLFQSLNKGVIVGEIIELEKEYADKVNEDLKLTFPEVSAVLVSTEEEVEETEPQAKKVSRRKKAVEVEETEAEA